MYFNRTLIAGVDSEHERDNDDEDDDNDETDPDIDDDSHEEEEGDEDEDDEDEDDDGEEGQRMLIPAAPQLQMNQEDEEEIAFESDNETHDAPLFKNYNEIDDDKVNEDEPIQGEDEPIQREQPRRSTRPTNPPTNYEPTFEGQKYQHLHMQTTQGRIQYDTDQAIVGALIIQKLNMWMKGSDEISLVQTYTLKGGLKKFGDKAYKATLGEMKQLHDRICFEPIDPKNLSPSERKRAMESLIFLTQKRDGQIKARTCANGSIQRDYMTKEDSASPTTALESVLTQKKNGI